MAPQYQIAGSGVVWPDLGELRIAYITPSMGSPPERQRGTNADVFRLMLEPGSVVTYAIEMRTSKLPELDLWEPEAYKRTTNSLLLYQIVIVGIAGVVAMFLTVIAVNTWSTMFSGLAALGWIVVLFISIESGFLFDIFDLSIGAERNWRAMDGALLGTALLACLLAYFDQLKLNARYSHFFIIGLALLLGLLVIVFITPAIAAGIARMSLFLVGMLGLGLVIHLAGHGYDRAKMLIPSWLLLVAWICGTALTVLGYVDSAVVEPVLFAGLLPIVVLMAFPAVRSLWR